MATAGRPKKNKTKTSSSKGAKIKKKDLAQILYVQEKKTLQEIAELLGIAHQTVSKWSTQEHWQDLRSGVSIAKEQQIMNLYTQVGNINDAILSREKRVPTPDESKMLSDLANAINKLESEIGIAELVSSGMKFCDFMRSMDADKAKEVNGYWDAFLRSMLA